MTAQGAEDGQRDAGISAQNQRQPAGPDRLLDQRAQGFQCSKDIAKISRARIFTIGFKRNYRAITKVADFKAGFAEPACQGRRAQTLRRLLGASRRGCRACGGAEQNHAVGFAYDPACH